MMNHGKSMKMTVLSLASAVAVLGMSSCLMGPDYKEPEMEVPAAFRGAPSMKESIASLPWWDVMRDPDLRDLLLDTYRNNRSLKATLANVDSARQNVTVTQAPLFPWASYGGSVSKGANQTGGSTIVNSGGITTAPGSMAASASWELDVWGRTRRAVEAAEADYFSAEHQLRALQLSLLRQVSTGYLQLLMLNMIYDLCCTAISWDKVDPESLAAPCRWDAGSIGRFMLWNGPVSSAVDLAVFGLLYFVFCPMAFGGRLYGKVPTVWLKRLFAAFLFYGAGRYLL